MKQEALVYITRWIMDYLYVSKKDKILQFVITWIEVSQNDF